MNTHFLNILDIHGFYRNQMINVRKSKRKVKVPLQVQTPDLFGVKNNDKKKWVFFSASLTLEASFILTMFLFASMALICPIYLVGMQGEIQCAMEETSGELALAAGLGEGKNGSAILSHIYVNSRMMQILGKDKLDASVIYRGSRGISLIESSFLKNSDDIELVARYQIQIPVPLLNLRRISFVQYSRKRAWTGRSGSTEGALKEQIVYVTAYGTVYHEYLSCKHLNTSIKSVDFQEIYSLRNKNGGIYYSCEFCKPGKEGEYYITSYGNRYHGSVTCKGVVVSIQSVPLSKVELPACKDCSRGGSR